MPARFAIALLIAFSCVGCAPEPLTPPHRDHGPNYSATDIYRLDFQGVRLGMPRDEACLLIVANGYRNRDGGDCGPAAPLRPGDDAPVDIFLGSQMRDCNREDCRPGSPADSVKFLSLTYERVDGRDVVRRISVDTAEPGQADALTAAIVRDWGRPTFFAPGGDGAHSLLIYGASPAQADPEPRNIFDRCVHSPDCEAERGIDCGAVISDYATTTAEVTIHDGGRWIQIEDRRAYARALRESGRLRGRRLSPGEYGCIRVPVG